MFAVNRWIMQRHYQSVIVAFLMPEYIKRSLKPADLTVIDFVVCFGEYPLVRTKPSSGGRDSNSVNNDRTGLEGLDGRIEGLLQPRFRLPPVIMIAFDQELTASHRADPGKIGYSFRETHRPGCVSGYDEQVIGLG